MKRKLLFGICLLMTSSIFCQNWDHPIQIKINQDAAASIDLQKKAGKKEVASMLNTAKVYPQQNPCKKTLNSSVQNATIEGKLLMSQSFSDNITLYKSNPTQEELDAITSLAGWTGQGLSLNAADKEMKCLGYVGVKNGWLETPALDLSANGGKFTLVLKVEAKYNHCAAMAVWVNGVKYPIASLVANGLFKFTEEYQIAITSGTQATKIRFSYDTLACESKGNQFNINQVEIYQMPSTPIDVKRLGENFNKMTLQTFPPYAWRNIDLDGDGKAWSVSAQSDGYEETSGAISWSWLWQYLNQDNWLVTPPLSVTQATDSIKFWLSSFNGNPEYYECRLSRTTPDIDQFTYILDTFRFSSAIPKGIQKQISLAQFVGDTVYVAFRHKFNGESERLCLMLDNVEGPAIVPFKQDLAVNEIIEPDDLSCDLCDRNIVVVLQNKGIEPIANFKLRCQSVGKLGERDTFSTLISEQVQRQILPGDTIHYAFLSTLPLSLYEEGPYFIRSFISVSGDQYAANDTLVGTFHKQKSSNIPFASGFEETDKDAIGWYYHTPSTAALKSFSIGENPLFANKGTGYLTSSVYTSFDTLAYPSRRGDDAFVATRCVRLEKENQYKINFYYAFRKCGGDAKVKKINMRVLIGADQHHLLENGKILFDTVLLWDRKFVTNGEQALYSFFNTNNFALEESGAYYLGFVFYSDDYVTDPSKEWMLFVDNVSITDAAAQQLVDLSLDQVLVPYDCNLGENETIALVVRNASTQALSNIKASYTIDNTQKVEETILDTIYPNTQFTYTFKTLANLSQHKKYRIQAKIAHLQDTVLENNENSQISENKTIAQLPFYDGFENIGTTVNFEDEYNVISTGYYTWSVVMDYTDNKEYAYKGSNFLVDATDNERYVIADDWIMGTCFEFQKDTTYQISIAYRIEKASVAIANLKLSILASYDTASLVQSLGDLNNITNTNYHIFNVEYTPSQTHIGHFAMHSLGQIQAPIVMLDELNISTKASIATEKSVDFNLQVSPNPAKDFIQITSSLQIDKIELINMMGGSVYAQHTHETLHNHVIPLANLPKGVYFLILNTTDNRRICKKIIVS